MKFSYLPFLVVLSVCYQSGSSCKDIHEKCPVWKQYCTSHRNWMKKNCQKTCNHCLVPGNWKCPEEGLNTGGRSQLGTATKSDSWEECAAKCAKEKDCSLWTWVKTTGGAYARNCALMSAAQKTVRDGNVISGVKTCQGAVHGRCVTSPNYPDKYEDGMDHTHRLNVPPGKGIEVTFKDLEVESKSAANGGGCYDYVQFLDANGERISKKICGTLNPSKFTISTSTATVKFISDGSVTRKGYKFCYKPIDKSCFCGLAKRKNTRIVGGTETNINEYPWLVALVFKKADFQGGKEAWGQCGGTLINDRWVLTAAHCVASPKRDGSWSNQTMDTVKVVLGEHDWSTKSETASITRNIIKMVRHTGYHVKANNDYDFTLLKIDPPVEFDKYKHIRPACLPETTNTGPEPDAGMAGDWATAAGWGNTQESGTNSDVTMQVKVKVQTSDQCKRDYAKEIARGMMGITDRMFCASVTGGGKDTCQNDSGGPLVYTPGDGVTAGQNYELKGVVSFGYGCARAGKPGVYAKVSYVLPWIKSIVTDGTWCPRT